MDINNLLKELTIEEKCSLVIGKDGWRTKNIDRLNIPSIFMADGPHGLRKAADEKSVTSKAIPAVCYPSLVTVASSFDPQVSYKMGKHIAKEFKANGVDLILGPGINIKRHPFCGRNFEYFSEDPKLTTKMAEGFIKGAKSEKVGICLKHYALNSQEDFRMTSNSIADDRAKYEIYYKSFMDLIKLEPEMIMCSYNKIDDVYASENIHHLKNVLREEFGFDGVIVSDWTAVDNRAKSLIATLDLEMPGYPSAVSRLIKEYKKGKIPINNLNNSVRRLLKLISKFKSQKKEFIDLEKNHQVSIDIAKESIVLLKNENNILPLSQSEKILMIGDMAINTRYQGGGSSHINSYKIDTIHKFLMKHRNVNYISGYNSKTEKIDSNLLDEIKNLAPNYEKIIFIGGLTDDFESEGYDRSNLSLPKNQEFIINQLSNYSHKIILVLQMGSPISMPFIKNVKAVLNCYLGGEGIGKAVDEIMFGKLSPSGRLAETFPLSHRDVPSDKFFKTGNSNIFYQESIYIGYRYYQSCNKKVLFPFGYGLSYSHFEYSNMEISRQTLTNDNKALTVSVNIKNNGPMDAKEVVMLFFEAKNPKTPRPKRELLDFSKILIKNKEIKTVKFNVTIEDLKYYNPKVKDFIVDDGIYSLQICKNARDILIEKYINVSLNQKYRVSLWNNLKSYQPINGLTFENEDFTKLINREIKNQYIIYKRPFTINNNIIDIENTFFGKLLKRKLLIEVDRRFESKASKNKENFKIEILQMPLRSLAIISDGRLKLKNMEFLIEMINHRYLKGLIHLLMK